MSEHVYKDYIKELDLDGKKYYFFDFTNLHPEAPNIDTLPYSIRILLENAVRNCDNFSVHPKDVEHILEWKKNCHNMMEIPFKPARVIMQDFTGVPAVVDLAAMRDAMKELGGNPKAINPLVPVDLVVDHSVQVDEARSIEALKKNQDREFERNKERFMFLKWGSTSFENLQIVPPGSGIVHQVNLEYLARSVFNVDGLLYPDTVVGTDSHTTMINGLGVLGWGVGGIEAEASMLGQTMSMVLPKVVGFKLSGKLPAGATATDVVLTVTEKLRKHGVVGKFVEFFGDGARYLSLADRATLSNMAPEYGATMGFFPVDQKTLEYLVQTGRSEESVKYIETYLRAVRLFRDLDDPNLKDPEYTETLELDLSTIVPCVAGPKRPHDRVPISDLKEDFEKCMSTRAGFKGFGVPEEDHDKKCTFRYREKDEELSHGDVVIAAITSCTNTSNPSVMLGAGLVAKKAREQGLNTRPFIKTSLSPGSGVVTKYLEKSGLQKYLDELGFNLVGYGCMTCIGNSGDLDEKVSSAITNNDLVVSAVLSGNRNFEARIHPFTRANYLASPPLVVAYALAGTVKINFDTEPIGIGSNGSPVFLKDIWPTPEEIEETIQLCVDSSMFKKSYSAIKEGNENWNKLQVPQGDLYEWDPQSTYIHDPPFFKSMSPEPEPQLKITNAYCLLNLGDSVTTDHISPAGNIAKNSPAARYLQERGVGPIDYNSYGSRRGNDEIMARGTFANVRLVNRLYGQTGPKTLYVPNEEVMDVFDASQKYIEGGHPLVILAGSEYGSGSSRDWAAKGPYLQGVKAVIAKSYERIHRSNLVGMGIIPLQFLEGQDADSLQLTGKEQFTIELPEKMSPGDRIPVQVGDGREFETVLRFDTEVELEYFKHGGILRYVLRRLKANSSS